MEIKYGGTLEFGDLIAISDGNCMSFGFYAGRGKSGTVQYYSLWSPTVAYSRYEEWLKISEEEKGRHWGTKFYKKGFSSKCLYKNYINAVYDTRIIKLTDPEGVFTDPEIKEQYNQAKEVLIKIGMIKNQSK